MFFVFFTPFSFLIFGDIQQLWMVFALYIVGSFGSTGIGMGVMHDANHGTYSTSPFINKILGYSLNIIGANSRVWKIQHNVLHHTFTNIDHADDDINVPPHILRFSPNAKRHAAHKYQHLYVWFLYGISTMIWVTIKDYVRLYRYHALGLVNPKVNMATEVVKVTLWKILYFSYTLVLPIAFTNFSWYHIFLGFLLMQFVTGVLMSVIFQLAHIMPDVKFPTPNDKGILEENWLVHQLNTTTNFAPNNKILSWCIGGLNFQVEHHLFPNICHIHYEKLSSIVKNTAKEFGVAYNCEKNFWTALAGHTRMLKTLGTQDLGYKEI